MHQTGLVVDVDLRRKGSPRGNRIGIHNIDLWLYCLCGSISLCSLTFSAFLL